MPTANNPDMPQKRDAVADGGAATVVVGKSWRMLLLWSVVGALMILIALATAAYFLVEEGLGDLLSIVAMVLALTALVVGLYLFVYAVGRIRDPEPPIAIGPAGLHDRWVSARPIPWAHIRQMRLHPGAQGGPYVIFELSDGDAVAAGVWPRRRWTARLSRALMGYGYRINNMCTDASTEKLVAMIRPFAEIGEADGPRWGW